MFTSPISSVSSGAVNVSPRETLVTLVVFRRIFLTSFTFYVPIPPVYMPPISYSAALRKSFRAKSMILGTNLSVNALQR